MIHDKSICTNSTILQMIKDLKSHEIPPSGSKEKNNVVFSAVFFILVKCQVKSTTAVF